MPNYKELKSQKLFCEPEMVKIARKMGGGGRWWGRKVNQNIILKSEK